MSRDSFSICQDCGVFQDNGTVLNATAMDWVTTVALFDEEAIKRERLNDAAWKIRAFLVKHETHGEGVSYWSWDWVYGEDDPLEGLTEELDTAVRP